MVTAQVNQQYTTCKLGYCIYNHLKLLSQSTDSHTVWTANLMGGLFTKFGRIFNHSAIYLRAHFLQSTFPARQSAILPELQQASKGQGEIICQNKCYKYSLWPSISKRNQNSFKLK